MDQKKTTKTVINGGKIKRRVVRKPKKGNGGVVHTINDGAPVHSHSQGSKYVIQHGMIFKKEEEGPKTDHRGVIHTL